MIFVNSFNALKQFENENELKIVQTSAAFFLYHIKRLLTGNVIVIQQTICHFQYIFDTRMIYFIYLHRGKERVTRNVGNI